jgi:hypothetical protein
MRSRFTEDDLLPGLMFIVLCLFAAVTPAQNDTFWHLRSGREMWETWSFLTTEPFSHTAHGTALQNHWWLSQLVFFWVHSIGGPFLLTVVAGACAVAAIVGSWRLTKGPWELRMALLGWLAIATAPEWAIRPQVISLALLVLVAHLIARDRLAWLPFVCVLWANLHAMVIFGVAVGGTVLLEALLWSRSRLKQSALIAAGCAVAPVVSPLGLNYWPQVLTTVSISRELQIAEYQMPLNAHDLPFWAGLGALLIVVILQRNRLAEYERSDRIMLLGALVLAAAAATAARNVAFFAVMAAPALSRLWPHRLHGRTRARVRPLGAVALGMWLTAATVGGVMVLLEWRNGGTRLGWHPMSSAAIAAISQCPDPIFNHLEDGGFLMWTLPDRRVFVDSRMEAYPSEVLRASRQADIFGDYEITFREYGINCALVTTGEALYSKLAGDAAMTRVFMDAERAVFVRTDRISTRLAQEPR